jgi:diaminohydroxyphosphoribosylaminopyrimidine deaminase/5-amino-6-(5-phosphoribosylamino)uracil reductase
MVGAVLVQRGKVIGSGWHHAAGQPHAEIEALESARRAGHRVQGATLFVTLEPCSTQGRTPPCTKAVIAAGIRRVVIAAQDSNPAHQGAGFKILKRAGLDVSAGLMSDEAARLNEGFNHWIVKRTPFVTLKAAMSLDGRIATKTGESKWITGAAARVDAMRLRSGADAVLVGVNTIVADDPSLTLRRPRFAGKLLRRVILDPTGRVPLEARVLRDGWAGQTTTVVVTKAAGRKRLEQLRRRAQVWVAPVRRGGIDLPWLLRALGRQQVAHLLVEGGGETHARFLGEGLAQRIVFYYAPIILGGAGAPKGVGGDGILRLDGRADLREAEWRRLGDDLRFTALI